MKIIQLLHTTHKVTRTTETTTRTTTIMEGTTKTGTMVEGAAIATLSNNSTTPTRVTIRTNIIITTIAVLSLTTIISKPNFDFIIASLLQIYI